MQIRLMFEKFKGMILLREHLLEPGTEAKLDEAMINQISHFDACRDEVPKREDGSPEHPLFYIHLVNVLKELRQIVENKVGYNDSTGGRVLASIDATIKETVNDILRESVIGVIHHLPS